MSNASLKYGHAVDSAIALRSWTLKQPLARARLYRAHGVGSAARKRRKLPQNYAVNISLKAWAITRAGSAVKLKVLDRDGTLRMHY
jgi:hypothetical protein